MNGKNIIVYSGGTAIASTISNDIDNSCELIETRTPSTGTAKDFVAGQNSWRIVTNFLVSAVGVALADILKVRNTYTLVIGATGQTGSTKYGLTGTAILQQCRITATKGALAQGSFVFQGKGELTEVQQPAATE